MVIFREQWDGNVFFARMNHWHQWFFDGFGVTQPSPVTDFQCFSIADSAQTDTALLSTFLMLVSQSQV